MLIRRNRSGTVLIYILVLVAAMSASLVTLISLSGLNFWEEVHREHAAQAESAIQGALKHAKYDLGTGTVKLPHSTTYTVGSLSCTVIETDNGSAIPGTASVGITVSDWSRTFSKNIVIGNTAPISSPTLYDYALASNSAVDAPDHVNCHGPVSQMYFNPTLSVGKGSNCDGNLFVTGSAVDPHVKVRGMTIFHDPLLPWPSPRNGPYLAAANRIFNGDQTWTNFAFLTPFECVYINGNLSFGGQITGSGTIYVTGDITLSDNVTAASPPPAPHGSPRPPPSNHVPGQFAFITRHDMILGYGAGGPKPPKPPKNPGDPAGQPLPEPGPDVQLTGFYFAGNSVILLRNLNLHNGAVISATFAFQSAAHVDLTTDTGPQPPGHHGPVARQPQSNQALAASLHMPGLWP